MSKAHGSQANDNMPFKAINKIDPNSVTHRHIHFVCVIVFVSCSCASFLYSFVHVEKFAEKKGERMRQGAWQGTGSK